MNKLKYLWNKTLCSLMFSAKTNELTELETEFFLKNTLYPDNLINLGDKPYTKGLKLVYARKNS